MKRTYKITPVSLYDIRGLESWLADMARRGLYLRQLRSTFSTFESDSARSIRFRVEPCRRTMMDDEPPQAMLDLYQDFGWSLVCDTNKELLVFSTEDETAPEPHSDPALQGELWKKLYRSKRRSFLFDLLLILIALIGAPGFIFRAGTPLLSLLTTVTPILILYLLCFLSIILPGLWADIQRLGLIVKQLEEGVQLDHWSVYPQRRWREIVHSVIIITLFAALFITLLPNRDRLRPLDELTAFPPLSLAEVEGEGFISRSATTGGTDYANFCAVNHYILCPNQWRVVQTGDIEPDNWIRMKIQWYDLPNWLSWLSAPLAQELLENAMGLKEDIWWTAETRNQVWTVSYYPREDAAFLASASSGPDGFQIAAAAVGSKAVLVEYTGNGNLAEHLEAIAAMVR